MPVKAMRLTRKAGEIVVTHCMKKEELSKLAATRYGHRYMQTLLSLLETEWR